MECGTAMCASLIVAEMLKPPDDEGAPQTRDIMEDFIHFSTNF